eukprot:5379630-Ditylum_brightwellii.AAC.1
MLPKRSKAMDMRFQWLRCRSAQKQFNIKWRRGKYNKADYSSKHHPPTVHQQRRSQFVVNSAECAANPNSVPAQIKQ